MKNIINKSGSVAFILLFSAVYNLLKTSNFTQKRIPPAGTGLSQVLNSKCRADLGQISIGQLHDGDGVRRH